MAVEKSEVVTAAMQGQSKVTVQKRAANTAGAEGFRTRTLVHDKLVLTGIQDTHH